MALDGGFAPGRIYDCYYRAEDPPVVGLGFTAVRDTAAFLRWADAGNPCAGAVERSYVFGVSQSGRFLRHLLYLGLDEDEAGRFVWDAVVPHVAGARRGEFNHRFGQPSVQGTPGFGHLPPFDDAGLLARQRAVGGVPKVVQTNTSAEYWRGDGSLMHLDLTGPADLAPAPETRIYHFAGTQHGAGALPQSVASSADGSQSQYGFNVVDYAPLLRAAPRHSTAARGSAHALARPATGAAGKRATARAEREPWASSTSPPGRASPYAPPRRRSSNARLRSR